MRSRIPTMSPPKSKREQSETIRQAADHARFTPPVSSDPKFAAVREAAVGSPALVHSPDDAPEFWLVPFVVADRACGYARIGLSGQVGQISIFGADPSDRQSWPNASIFAGPPSEVLTQIRERFGSKRLSEPVFAYDGSPARWAWRIRISNGRDKDIFISSGGWYERPLRHELSDREG